jgi:hypothetical protein
MGNLLFSACSPSTKKKQQKQQKQTHSLVSLQNHRSFLMHENKRLGNCIQQDHESAKRAHIAKNTQQRSILLRSKQRNTVKQGTVIKYIGLVENVISQFELKMVMVDTFDVLQSATGSMAIDSKGEVDNLSVTVDDMITLQDSINERSDITGELLETNQSGSGDSDEALFAQFEQLIHKEEVIPTSAVVPRYGDKEVKPILFGLNNKQNALVDTPMCI